MRKALAGVILAAVSGAPGSALAQPASTPSVKRLASTAAGSADTASAPNIVANTRIAPLDPASFGPSGGALMDFTYAASGFAGGADAASSGSPDGIASWAMGFSGRRVEQSGGLGPGSVTGFSGAVAGYEETVRPGLQLGAFAGGGTLAGKLGSNAGSARSDIAFGGLSARVSSGPAFASASLMGGALWNSGVRNLSAGMILGRHENIDVSFGGGLVQSAAGFGYRYALPDGWTLTPALKLRYFVAGLGDYCGAGPDANLTLAGRMLQDLEQRAEVSLSRTLPVDGTSDLRFSVHAGLLGLERIGGGGASGSPFAPGVSYDAPGADAVTGAYAGADLDFRIGERLSVVLAGDYATMNDPAEVFTANAGLRWEF
jgi:hypothetical protein